MADSTCGEANLHGSLTVAQNLKLGQRHFVGNADRVGPLIPLIANVPHGITNWGRHKTMLNTGWETSQGSRLSRQWQPEVDWPGVRMWWNMQFRSPTKGSYAKRVKWVFSSRDEPTQDFWLHAVMTNVFANSVNPLFYTTNESWSYLSLTKLLIIKKREHINICEYNLFLYQFFWKSIIFGTTDIFYFIFTNCFCF